MLGSQSFLRSNFIWRKRPGKKATAGYSQAATKNGGNGASDGGTQEGQHCCSLFSFSESITGLFSLCFSFLFLPLTSLFSSSLFLVRVLRSETRTKLLRGWSGWDLVLCVQWQRSKALMEEFSWPFVMCAWMPLLSSLVAAILGSLLEWCKSL